MKIGVLGGTFDPIHQGHLEIAKKALLEFNLDKVYLVPTGNSYHKAKTKASALERYQMVELALKGQGKLFPSKVDVERLGPTFTIDTIRELKEKEPGQYYFIMGSDTFKGILAFKNLEQLILETKFLVTIRSGEDLSQWQAFLETLPQSVLEETQFFKLDPVAISSSEIREHKVQGEYLNQDVLAYIKEKRLY